MDDSGFKRLRVVVSFPDAARASRVLEEISGHPDVEVSLHGAEVFEGEARFELDLFGVSTEVDELLEMTWRWGGVVLSADPRALSGTH